MTWCISEEAFPEHFKKLFEICKSFISEGSPKEGKHAIKCLFLNSTKSKVIYAQRFSNSIVDVIVSSCFQKESFEKILEIIKENLSLGKHVVVKFSSL